MTQRQLAKELHIAVSTLNGYIMGNRQPDYETLCKIALYLGVTTDCLLNIQQESVTDLSSEEKRLLTAFKQLTREQKVYLVEQARVYIRFNSNHSNNV